MELNVESIICTEEPSIYGTRGRNNYVKIVSNGSNVAILEI
jgi:hypothetical protein